MTHREQKPQQKPKPKRDAIAQMWSRLFGGAGLNDEEAGALEPNRFIASGEPMEDDRT